MKVWLFIDVKVTKHIRRMAGGEDIVAEIG
jgi:hypothetical protein